MYVFVIFNDEVFRIHYTRRGIFHWFNAVYFTEINSVKRQQ